MKRTVKHMAKHMVMAAVVLAMLVGTAIAKNHGAELTRDRIRDRARSSAADRICTPADVARFEAMLGGLRKGQYRTDPRFLVTVHYLGTAIVKGTCNVALRPAD